MVMAEIAVGDIPRGTDIFLVWVGCIAFYYHRKWKKTKRLASRLMCEDELVQITKREDELANEEIEITNWEDELAKRLAALKKELENDAVIWLPKEEASKRDDPPLTFRRFWSTTELVNDR